MDGGKSTSRAERDRQLQWLMTLRVVTVTSLLVSAFAIELLVSPMLTLKPLFLLTAGSYLLVLLWAVLDRWLKGTVAFLILQLVGDVGIISLFIQITGGIDSPMSFLYLLPITVAALLLVRRGALVIAAIAFASYTALIMFGAARTLFGDAPSGGAEPDAGRVVYFLIAHLVAMVAVALLSAYLAERLRVQNRELAERRGAVARLQALNENIIESINSGLITTDPEGRINFINRGGVEILGHELAQVDGEPIDALLGRDAEFMPEMRRRLLAERRVRFEQNTLRRDGGEIFLGVAISTLHDRLGKPLGYIFIFQDLTEIQALELEVRLRERMSALGEMAAGMAHELRNPLAAISGSVQYLKSSLKPGGETLELMDIVLRESHRLDLAIRDFLTFTRPGPFAASPVDLVRLLDDQLKLLQNSRELDGAHRIHTEYAEPSISIDADADRLKQVFWNLSSNALKAMPDGGTLSIGVRRLAGERVEIRFADEGVGMTEAQRENYFQPFSSSFRDGTGLGAAIVYRLVEEHGGKILLETAEGRGTTVRVVLPERQGAAGECEAPERIRRWAIGG